MAMEISIRYAVVFQKDELQLEEVLEDLGKYGTVEQHVDDELISDDGECCPVVIVVINSNFGSFNRLKWDYHCVPTEDNQYVLLPSTVDAWKEYLKSRAC